MLFTREKAQGFLLALTFVAVFTAGYVVNETAGASAASTVAFTADGIIRSSDGGFQFPDGTLQATAAANAGTNQEALTAIRRQSVNQGLYDNRIPEFTHDRDYVEICFTDGLMEIDENDAGTSTTGGNCTPGDVGWIIERDERTAATWTDARAECLKLAMRFPEVFEFQLTCDNAAFIGIIDLDNANPEWVSNRPFTKDNEKVSFNMIGAIIMGDGSCDQGSIANIARSTTRRSSHYYRCAL